MVGAIAVIQLNPMYGSWQDKYNRIYLTANKPKAEITADMDLEFIKSSLRQKVIYVVEGEISLDAGSDRFKNHERIFFDTTWEENKLIVGPDGSSINGIQVGRKDYQFKSDINDVLLYIDKDERFNRLINKKIQEKIVEAEQRIYSEYAKEINSAKIALDGSEHASIALRIEHDLNSIKESLIKDSDI